MEEDTPKHGQKDRSNSPTKRAKFAGAVDDKNKTQPDDINEAKTKHKRKVRERRSVQFDKIVLEQALPESESSQHSHPVDAAEETERDNINAKAREAQRRLEEKEAEEECQTFLKEYINALRPFLIFSKIFSRFPIKLDQKSDGSFIFSYDPSSLSAMMFLVLHAFVMIVSLIIACNFLSLLMDYPRHSTGGITGTDPKTARSEELYIFKRNLAPLIIFFSCLFHVNVGNWNFYLKRQFAVTYLNFWPEALRLLRFNAAVGIKRSMVWIIGCYCLFLVLMVILVVLRIAPVTSGAPGLIATLLVRLYNPSLYATSAHFALQVLVSVFVLYIFISSKSFPLLFIIKCKLLRNSFALWNRRLDIILNKGEAYFPKEVAESLTDRVSFPDLFRGHVLLLDLLEGNDELFSETIESYLGSQITSIVFELYYFSRAQAGNREFAGTRALDQIVVGLYLAHSMVFLCLVVFTANAVNVEAMDGLEIIRRRGFIGKKSNDELYFLLSMYVSYTGHFETAVSAAGYFVYNKSYFAAIFGAIATYLVIFLQFGPPLAFEDAELRPLIVDEFRLLQFVEDTADLFPSTNVGALLMDAFELGTNETSNGIFY